MDQMVHILQIFFGASELQPLQTTVENESTSREVLIYISLVF